MLLLHGLLGSGRFWGGAYDQLGTGHQLVVPDLLGFGRSPHPASGYRLDDHADAVLAMLDDLAILAPVTIAAHSFGALVALRVAQLMPERVRGIIAFGPPLYTDDTSARDHVADLGGLARLLAFDTPLAERVCGWMCAHRTLAAALARTARPDLPGAVAVDSVNHTWASYSATVNDALLVNHGAGQLVGIDVPVVLIGGDADRVIDRGHLARLADVHPNIGFEQWRGGHDLPIRMPHRCVGRIEAMLGALPPPE